MTPQERELLTSLIGRLRQAPAQAKDQEADQLIAQLVRERPDAAYVLAQTVLIQDYSLHQAQARIAELESQPPAAAAGAGSFLGNLFGRPQPAAAPSQLPQQPQQPAAGPWGGQPAAGGFGQGGGGSFLRNAAATAAGVAGGALLFSGIQSLFGHGFGGLGGFGGTALAAQPSITETVINNYGSDPSALGSGALDTAGINQLPDQNFTPASGDLAAADDGFSDAGFDPGGDFGGDFGGTDV
jgi:hypothetical protein